MRTLAAIFLVSVALQSVSSALDLEYLGFRLEITADDDVYQSKGSWEHFKHVTIAMAGLHGVDKLRLQFVREYKTKAGVHEDKGGVYRIQRVGRGVDGYFRIFPSGAPTPAVAAGETLQAALKEFFDKAKAGPPTIDEPRLTPNR